MFIANDATITSILGTAFPSLSAVTSKIEDSSLSFLLYDSVDNRLTKLEFLEYFAIL
ncbi:MAG: hypothetical protein ACYCSO_07160 [Cuniculiplasma sp.]